MNQYLMKHLRGNERIPRHAERSKRIREAVEEYLKNRDVRTLLYLHNAERDVALEILEHDAPGILFDGPAR